MWTPGPFERKPTRAYYYLTDVDPSWPAERQDEHLRDFNYPTLWSISIHEVYPGHFLHYQHLRQVESKVRKSILFSLDLVRRRLGALLRADDDRGRLPAATITRVRLGQLAEALIRLCRFIVGIRLHSEDMSVEQGVRFFRDEAFLEEASARREAERGTFDPTYLVYTAGKLMLLKLRRGLQGAAGRAFSLRAFHDTLLAQRHRAVLAASRADARRRQNGDDARIGQVTHAPLRIQCDACGHRFEKIQKFSDPPRRRVPEVRRGPVHKLMSSPAIQFKGTGWYITDYAKKSGTDAGKTGGRREERRRSRRESEVRLESREVRARTPAARRTRARRRRDDIVVGTRRPDGKSTTTARV